MNRRYLAAGTAALMTMFSVFSPVAALAEGESLHERVTLTPSGGQATGQFPALSANGALVAFASTTANLVPGDTNAKQDVFVRDRATQTIERVSVGSAGAQSNGVSAGAGLSADGRFVVFHSTASNLSSVADTNATYDIFVHDRATRSTELVSAAPTGESGNGLSMNASISDDGRYVAFASDATNLVDGDTNGARDVFVRDRLLGTIVRIGLVADYPAISRDGRYVAFSSTNLNGVPGAISGRHIYVWQRETGVLERASVSEAGVAGNGASMYPALSTDGRFVAFESDANNLVAGDTNARRDVFVRDRQAGTTERVSVTSQGAQGNEASTRASISGDGRLVVFESVAQNLVPMDGNGVKDVFLHDRATRQTRRVTVTNSFTEANQASYGQVISADGSAIAFHSTATNLVTGDTNYAMDIFVARTALVPPPPELTKLVTPGVRVMAGEPAELTAILTVNGAAVADRLIQFDVAGDGAGTATTGSDGTARVTYPWTSRPGTYSVRSFFRGDLSFARAISYGTLRVGDPNTVLTLNNHFADPGQTVTLSAVLATAQGERMAGKTVTFSVDDRTVGTATTDAQGKAQLTYVAPAELGELALVAAFAGADPYHPASASAVLNVVGVPPTELTVANEQGSYGSTFPLRAFLKQGEAGVAGQTVQFQINGASAGTAVTNELGAAVLDYTALLAPGTYELKAAAALETPVEATGTLVVTVASASLSYTGDTLATGDPFTLRAKLNVGGTVANPAPVTFALFQGTALVGTHQAPLGADKVAELTLPSLWGAHTVRVSWPSDLYQVKTVEAQIQGPVQPSLELAGPADPAWTNPSITLIARARPSARVTVYGREKLTGAGIGQVTVTTGAGGTVNVVFPGLPDGTYEFWPEADQLVGNTVAVFKDSTAPVTTALLPAPNANSWYNAPVTVRFAAIDREPGTGVDRLEIQSGNEWLLYSSESVTVETEGYTQVCVRAVDRAGNVENCRPVEIALDLQAPEVMLRVDSELGEFSLTAVDNLSGVERTEYSLDGGQTWILYEQPVALPGDDQYTVRYRSVDLAGNERQGSETFVADRTPPTVTLSGVTEGTAYDGTATPVWQEADALSGVVQTTATLDGIPWQNGEEVTEAGPHTLIVTVEDSAGNRSEVVTTFTVYHTPEVQVEQASAQYSDPVELTAVVMDSGAPVSGAEVTFAVANQPVGTAVTGPDGVARLQYVVTQPAGVYTVSAAYAGDESNWLRPAAGEAALTVTEEQAEIALSVAPARFSAQVAQQADGADGDLSLLQVRFLVKRINGDGTTSELAPLTAPVSAAGEASVVPTLPEGAYTVAAELVKNAYFVAPTVGAGGAAEEAGQTVTVTDGKGFTTGGVWWGNKDQAEFQVRPDQKGGAVTGMFRLRTAGLNLTVTQFDWLVVTPTDMQFQGRSGSYVVKVAGIPAKGKQPLRFNVTVLQAGVEVYSTRWVPVQGSVNVQP